MSKVITIHEYKLKAGVSDEQFEAAVAAARERNLFDLPGLMEYRFLKLIRGTREPDYAAIWIYKDRPSWEKIWGEADNPVPKEDYPDKWKIWENEILSPLLAEEPDRIFYAAYEDF